MPNPIEESCLSFKKYEKRKKRKKCAMKQKNNWSCKDQGGKKDHWNNMHGANSSLHFISSARADKTAQLDQARGFGHDV